MMFTVALLILSTILGLVQAGDQNAVWSFTKPGDIVLHGIFPLRTHVGLEPFKRRSVINLDGLIWMGAMIERISKVNRASLLPGNLTIGYNIRDSTCHPDIGIRQTLSIANRIINNERAKTKKEFHFPGIIGPACDSVESKSHKLLDMFNISRIFYTTTSSRFYNPYGNILRTVPSDLVHIEALLRVLNDMNKPEVCVVSSLKDIWRERANVFEFNMKKHKIPLKNVVYTESLNNISHFASCKVVVLFTGASSASRLIKRRSKSDLVWITMSEFDDPLFRVFDETGNVSNKTIICSTRKSNFLSYKKYLIKKLGQNSGTRARKNWLNFIFEEYKKECRNRSRLEPDCSREIFQQRIETFIETVKSNLRSSMSLQGVVDAVDIVVNSVKDVLKRCNEEPLSCLSSNGDWLTNLRNTKIRHHGKTLNINKHGVLKGSFSVRVLRRTKSVFGRRMLVQKGWVYKKVQEWNITEDLSYLRLLVTNKSVNTTLRAMIDNTVQIVYNNDILSQASTRGQNKSCPHCDSSGNCKSTVANLDWSNSWAIVLYLIQFFILCALISSLVYFIKHKNSPIMVLCCSWPDNIVLVVLCLFTCLPTIHIGEQSFVRCLTLWPVVNIIFGFYAALLLTKTLLIQNVLKCEVATDRPGRRMMFSISIILLQLIILIAPSALGFATTTRTACIPRGLVVVCDIEKSTGIFFSMAVNCFLLILLVIFAIRETVKQRKNFCRTENLIGVASVALVSYICSIIIAYFNFVLKSHVLVTLVNCLLHLANPVVCLTFIYVPILRLVSTWLRQHIRQQKNLTSIKRAQVMSAKRQSAGPITDAMFDINFSPEISLIPSRNSGYYFDMRPTSANPNVSYPNSLIRSVHEPTHVVFGYGRCATTSGDESAGFQTSMDELETISRDSFYDNVPNPNPTKTNFSQNRLAPNLLRKIPSFYDKESDDVFTNKQCEENIELSEEGTKKWPSLEGLRASDI